MRQVSELSPNQIVAYNLEKLRRERGWTAAKTAALLGAQLGRKISLASYSAMERSVEGRRIKSFDADDIFALARVFGVRVWQLFLPPINYPSGTPPRLHPVRVRLKGSPPDKSLGTDAATGLVIESPEAIFAGTAAFAAGGRFAPREKPKPSHRASEPMDAAVLQVVTNLLTRAPATSALEEQKQSEELISFLKEIHEARQNRPAMPSEGKSVQERKRQRSKKR
jgi:transcriptional regulator with XRE-family HTH domain